jgi:hypothetical protein
MLEVGLFLLGLGAVLIVRVERAVGFKHLLDRVWIHNDLSPSPIMVGRSAVVAKYVSRALLLSGAILVLIGAAVRSW